MAVSQYDIFVKAVDTGSLTGAAEALGCTQSNASHALQALEREFGFPLLRRGRRGVQPTAEGERVLPAVRQVCDALRELESQVGEIRAAGAGTLRIGSFTSVAVHWLPEILRRFQEACPGVEFELLSGDYHDVRQWLSAGEVDAAFVRLPMDLPCPAAPLYEDPLVAILPKGHPKAALERFPLQAIRGEPFISLPENSNHDSIRVLQDAGLAPDVRFVTKDDYALIAMVREGLGMSIVPRLLLEGRMDGLAALPLQPPVQRVIALAVSDAGAHSALCRRFCAFVAEWIQKKEREP